MNIHTQHQELVQKLKKNGNDILMSLTPQKCDALHMAVGIAGEAGELLDAIKKWTVYSKKLDEANVVEELGDLLFYITGLAQALNLDMDEILRHNIDKLTIRYGEKYSDEAAQARKDKAYGTQV